MSETKLDAKWIRQNPWITALSCLPWAASLALVIATLVTRVPVAFISPHLAILGLAGFVAAWRRKPYARQEPVELTIDDNAVRIGGESIPRAHVRNAELMPTLEGPVVRVTSKRRLARDLLMEDEAAAHRLSTALGFDASQRTATYRPSSLAIVRYRSAPFVLAGAYMALVLFGGWVPTLFPLLMLSFPILMLSMFAVYLKRASLVVGVDGLLLRWLWIREFIATKDIISVHRFDQGFGRNRVRGVELVTKGGSVKLPMKDDDAAMLRQRVVDVVELARSATHVADDAMVLARGDLAMRQWITRLKALGAGATATLRTAAVMPEQLWRVASDPAQPAGARAAAAVALSSSLDDEGKARLADIAKTTAEPKLRVALERAGEGAADEELEQALIEMEAKS